jgi:NADH dehydrogenase/NADH:ubiquinone oxidoreductase subunit G
LCTPILVNIKESEIVRIQPKADAELENLIISDKIRFCYDSLKKNRIQKVFQKNFENTFLSESWGKFFDTVSSFIQSNKKITFLINENLDLKSAQLLKNIESNNIKVLNISNFNTKYKNNYDSSFFDKISSINKKIKTCFLISTNLKTETTLLNTKLRLKYNKNFFSIISTGSFYKSNYPTTFINLSTQNIIKLFEGKITNSRFFLTQSNTLLMIGNAFSKRIKEVSYILNLFKKVCPTGLVIQNQIHANSVGIHFLGINSLKKNILKSTDYFFCLNLEDNIKTRKLILNKKFFWFNTHGSVLAGQASFILPTLTFFENESIYINIDANIKKSQKVLPALKDSRSVYSILKSLFKEIEDRSKFFIEYSTDKNHKTKFKQSLIKNHTCTHIFSSPNKSVLENSYGDNVLTKNSIILSQRIQEQLKNNHTTF